MMAAPDWDWRTAPSQQKHSERVTMIRPIEYESTSPIDPDLFEEQFHSRQGKALTLNISSGGRAGGRAVTTACSGVRC